MLPDALSKMIWSPYACNMGSYRSLLSGLFLASFGIRRTTGTPGGRIPIYRVQRALLPNLSMLKSTVDVALSSANEL